MSAIVFEKLVPTEQKGTRKLASPKTTLESPHKLDRTRKPAKINCACRNLSIHIFLFAFALFVRPEWGGHFFRCSTADYLALASDFILFFPQNMADFHTSAGALAAPGSLT